MSEYEKPLNPSGGEIPGAPHREPLEVPSPLGADLQAQLYRNMDMVIQNMAPDLPMYRTIKTLDDLLERDAQREKDGFKRKIRLGKVVKPVENGGKKIVIVPTTTEDKFYHDRRTSDENEENGDGDDGEGSDTGESPGTAEGDEGDVIGERPLFSEQEGEGEGQGAGSGGGSEHELGQTAYNLGKVLTEKFQLPNLKEKGKKKSLTRYVYDLTDRHFGAGQILDKKQTLKQIIKTNIGLERFDPTKEMDPNNLIINPRDYCYRVMSREKDVESQAVVFFVRDYSGSMYGKPTEVVCSQHVMIYSWLMYQYKEQVESRFILHDTEAREVKDFYTYYNTHVAGGTQIRSAFELVNQIVEKESLQKDYNIYVFYGSDGDDFNSDKDAFLKAFDKMFTYVNRLGMTIIRNSYAPDRMTVFENFIQQNRIVEDHKELARLDTLGVDADDPRIIDGIKQLVS